LVVLADRWDIGWKAYLNGRPAPILCVNHILRGVEVPAGAATLQFRYEPASFAWGLWLSVLSLIVCLGWGVGAARYGTAPETGVIEERRPFEGLPKNDPVKSKEKMSKRKDKSKQARALETANRGLDC
jgi:hypothetical protein